MGVEDVADVHYRPIKGCAHATIFTVHYVGRNTDRKTQNALGALRNLYHVCQSKG